jgi:hypothetical protein
MVFRDLIFHNFRRKLFALALAILIWLTIHYAQGPRNPDGRRQFPLTNSVENK